jgi:hypothetical protein
VCPLARVGDRFNHPHTMTARLVGEFAEPSEHYPSWQRSVCMGSGLAG